jgi:hypothetical protein
VLRASGGEELLWNSQEVVPVRDEDSAEVIEALGIQFYVERLQCSTKKPCMLAPVRSSE